MAIYLADFAWSKPSIAALKAAGYSGVLRYLSYDTTGKNLTRSEAAGYLSAGLTVTSNWEFAATAALGGYSQGAQDAAAALVQHLAAGGTKADPIYFSVDWDVSDGQKPTVGQYFKGVASVIGKPMTGAYGSHYTIKYLFDNGLITYGWGTYAWSGSFRDPRCHIQQIQNGVKIGGADCDRNQAMKADYGQWSSGKDEWDNMDQATFNNLMQGYEKAVGPGNYTRMQSIWHQPVANTSVDTLGTYQQAVKALQKYLGTDTATDRETPVLSAADLAKAVQAVKDELDTVKDLASPAHVVDPAQLAAALTQVPDFYDKLAAAVALNTTVSVGKAAS